MKFEISIKVTWRVEWHEKIMQRWHGDYVQIWVKGMTERDIDRWMRQKLDTRGVIGSRCMYEGNEKYNKMIDMSGGKKKNAITHYQVNYSEGQGRET